MKRSVLVVDDDEAIRRLLASLLETGGYAAVCAADGQQAVDLAREHRPDLVLMDLLMPGLGGREAILQLRALPGGSDLPIVVVTASSTKEHILEARKAGADDILTKNFFEAGVFLRRIEKILEGHAQKRAPVR